ncbi:MAG TPA: hypothetical protein VEW26_06975 [Allosphingosinicella sp.]|nr:hypothetical protein [Allosphingosinicella sp.]
MSRSPPLRFLAIVLGGWAAVRTAIVAPPWSTPPADAAAGPRPPRLARTARATSASLPAGGSGAPISSAPERDFPRSAIPPHLHSGASPEAERLLPPPPDSRFEAATASTSSPPSLPGPLAAARGPAPPGRWSLSAWTFVRPGDSVPLAPAGLLGGSQAGARLAYRLNRDRERPLALSLRLSGPLRRAAGSEVALGFDWRPSRRLPLHLLAERRQALGREARSAFALTLYGGASDAPVGRFRLDAYAQAGVVGARSLDPFADGSARLSLPLSDRLRVGAGAWAAAQPGLVRLDLGPQAALRLPVPGREITLAVDWRLRVAGNAEPGSGPALTLATDF